MSLKLRHTLQIKIQVEGLNDVYEGIRAPFYEFEIMENVPPGFMVGSIAIDEKDDYMFRMVSVEWDNLFEIGTSDGIILSKAEIDYEQVSAIEALSNYYHFIK